MLAERFRASRKHKCHPASHDWGEVGVFVKERDTAPGQRVLSDAQAELPMVIAPACIDRTRPGLNDRDATSLASHQRGGSLSKWKVGKALKVRRETGMPESELAVRVVPAAKNRTVAGDHDGVEAPAAQLAHHLVLRERDLHQR